MNNYTPPYKITSKILKLSTQISEELTKLQFTGVEKVNPMLRKKNRIKTLAGTLEIEGNFLGEEKITAILDGKRVLGTVKELAEVQGAIKAYERLDNYRFDELDDLLQAHKILMDEILTTAGSFRSVNVKVGEHIAPKASMVNELMINLFSWLKNSDEHMLLKSCIFHYEFEFIHPFSDGNGRIGRLWQTLILSHWQPMLAYLPVETVIKHRQQEYYQLLTESDQKSDCSAFIEFLLQAIECSLQEAISTQPDAVLEHARVEVLVETRVKTPVKTPEQILLLLQQNPYMTLSEVAVAIGKSTSAVERAVAKLKRADKLVFNGPKKDGYWQVVK